MRIFNVIRASDYDHIATLTDLIVTQPNAGTGINLMGCFNSVKWQNLCFAIIPGNFKGKTVTVTKVLAYSGTTSTDVTSTSSIAATNDFDLIIQSTGDVAGKMAWVTVTIA